MEEINFVTGATSAAIGDNAMKTADTIGATAKDSRCQRPANKLYTPLMKVCNVSESTAAKTMPLKYSNITQAIECTYLQNILTANRQVEQKPIYIWDYRWISQLVEYKVCCDIDRKIHRP